MGRSKTKSMDGRPKETTRAEDYWIKVTSFRNRRLNSRDITAQLNQCRKNVSTYTVRRRLSEDGLCGRITGKKTRLRKQNNVKRLQWTKALKVWIIEQWNKVLWTDESKFEIFVLNKRFYVRRRIEEKAAISCIKTTVKYAESSFMQGGGFSLLQSRRFAPSEGQIESDRRLQQTAALRDPIRNVACVSRIHTHAR